MLLLPNRCEKAHTIFRVVHRPSDSFVVVVVVAELPLNQGEDEQFKRHRKALHNIKILYSSSFLASNVKAPLKAIQIFLSSIFVVIPKH